MLALLLTTALLLPSSQDEELRALVQVIEVTAEGGQAQGLRAWLEVVTKGTPFHVAIEPGVEDAFAQILLPLPRARATLPEQLERCLADVPRPPILRVQHGRVILLSPERDQKLRADRRAREDLATALEERPVPGDRGLASFTAAWGHPVEVDPRLKIDFGRDLPSGTARSWLTAAADQAGAVLALRAQGVLLTTPERAARIARGPVADLLLANDLRTRTLAAPAMTKAWQVKDLIDRLVREFDLEWPAHLRLAGSHTLLLGPSSAPPEITLGHWLNLLTGWGGNSVVDGQLVEPRWRIREGRVEIYDARLEGTSDLSDEHDD